MKTPYGIEILLELMGMENATVLLGNHELMMLNAIKGSLKDNPMGLWNRNGGMFTRMEFGNQSAETQRKILRYLSSLPLTAEVAVGEKEYLLVHGAPPELHSKTPSQYTDAKEFSVWTRLYADDPVPEAKRSSSDTHRPNIIRKLCRFAYGTAKTRSESTAEQATVIQTAAWLAFVSMIW